MKRKTAKSTLRTKKIQKESQSPGVQDLGHVTGTVEVTQNREGIRDRFPKITVIKDEVITVQGRVIAAGPGHVTEVIGKSSF